MSIIESEEPAPAIEADAPDRRIDGPDRAADLPERPANAPPPTEALDDAEAIVERARRDEEAAAEARDEYRARGLPRVEPDPQLEPQLGPDERVHARRSAALVERTPPTAAGEGSLRGGTLYLTSERLVHLVQQEMTWVPLEEIVEMGVAIERLVMLQLRDGTGIAIEADQPRLLRVQIAAAMAAQRASR